MKKIHYKETKPSDERWRSCAICKNIPPVCHEYKKDGKLEEELPTEISKLESTNYEPRALGTVYKCPLCGTKYDRTDSYEWYTTGGEDTVTFTRLTD